MQLAEWPELVLDRLLRNVLGSSALLLTCRRLRDRAYALYDGPPDDLSGYTFYSQLDVARVGAAQLTQALDKSRHLAAHFSERLAARDAAFVLRCVRKNPAFVRSLTHPLAVRPLSLVWAEQRVYCVHDTGILHTLARDGDLELFALIVSNLQMPCLGADGELELAHAGRLDAPPLPHAFFRLLVQHNLRNGYHLERSGCTACRQRPLYHREWTLRRLLANDDLELLIEYLALRFPLGRGHMPLPDLVLPTPEGAYALREATLLRLYEHRAAAIAAYWRATGRTAQFSAVAIERWAARVDTATLCFAVRFGLDLFSVAILRRALRRGDAELALLLLERYAYALTAQDVQHLQRHAARLHATDHQRRTAIVALLG